MSTCHSVGISGNCGHDCPVLWEGDCGIPEEALEEKVNEILTESATEKLRKELLEHIPAATQDKLLTLVTNVK